MPISTSGTTTGVSPTSGVMVVVRFLDRRLLKGTTQDFAPNRLIFHVYEGGDLSSKAVEVELRELKAVLYVKDFEGNSERRDEYRFDKVAGHGRKAQVTFEDGEVIAGYVMGYHADRPGFFLIPADAESNNERVFVLNHAVKSLEWIR